jgi:Family of unknown function (DUF6510)
VDVTSAMGRCASCGTTRPLATSHAYVEAAGTVAACPWCSEGLLRLVNALGRTLLMSAACLSSGPPRPTARRSSVSRILGPRRTQVASYRLDCQVRRAPAGVRRDGCQSTTRRDVGGPLITARSEKSHWSNRNRKQHAHCGEQSTHRCGGSRSGMPAPRRPTRPC